MNRIAPGVLSHVRKEAALAVMQGWKSVPVDPQVVLRLADAYAPPPVSDQTKTIESLRLQLRDAKALLKESQRAVQRKFADGVAHGRQIRDNLSRHVE